MSGIDRLSASLRTRRALRGLARRQARHRGRRAWTVEALEDRTLLSTFTVNNLGDAGAGTGLSGDLRYVITQADSTVGDNQINFSVTGTITLDSALPDLSNTTGLTDIEGPGATKVTVARSSAAGTPNFGILTVGVDVQAKLAGLTITGGSPDGNGGGIENHGTLTITNCTIAGNTAGGNDGGGIDNRGTLTVTNSNIANNSAHGGNGGGIENFGGTLTVTNSNIANNSAPGNGGGIDNSGNLTVNGSAIANNTASGGGGGGIENSGGTLTITNSTIGNNSAGGSGGGIENSGGALTVTNSTIANDSASFYGGGYGGGIDNNGSITVTNSTIADNSAYKSGGIYNNGTMAVTNSTIADNSAYRDGAIYNSGSMTIANSTIVNNSATAAFSSGGGIDNEGTLMVTNSTIANDSANFGGGIANDKVLTVVNSTIAYNNVFSGGTGGGLGIAAGTTTLDNTVVALNSIGTGSGATASDIAGTVSSSSSSNLIGTGGSGGLTNGKNGNQVGVANPGLGPLADHGGPTQTIALVTGSPAIDAGSNALAVDPTTQKPLTTDQRGPGFLRIVHGTVDIGAFEVQSTSALVVTAQPPATVTAGSGFGLTVEAVDSSGKVISSYNGTFTVALATNPGGAVLGGTLSVTAKSGVATFSGLMLNGKVGTGYTLVVSSSDLRPAITNPLDVTPAAATQLVITQSPAGTLVGAAFRLVVTAEDQFGNVNPAFGGSVAVALSNNPVGATLGGALSVTPQGGVATFSGLTLNKPGVGYTLQVSSNGLTAATTEPFNVTEVGTIFTVNSLGDTGTGSGLSGDLRYVITQADLSLGSIIDFSVTGTIQLVSALPDLGADMTINGPGASSLTVARSGASGTPDFSIFTVDADVRAKLAGLTITGGLSDLSDGNGGGIENDGTMTIANCSITGNTAGGPNAYVAGGGIDNRGTLTVTNSTIANNFAGGNGGGIDNRGMLTVTGSTIANNSNKGGGGGIENDGAMTATDSTIANNSSFGGGGIDNLGALTITDSTIDGNSAGYESSGGGISNGGTMTITDSTIDNNGAFDLGGGIVNDSDGSMSITNSTIADNAAGPAGGGIINAGTLTVTNSTVVDNSAAGTFLPGYYESGYGSGIAADSALTLDNTIVAMNTTSASNGATSGETISDDIDGTVSSSSAYNLIGTGGSGGLINGTNGNLVGVANPGLGPLADNGGPTQTIALLPGSPAIDAGSNALAVDPSTGQPLATDQRGPGFVRIVNGTVDIGAYEFTPGANDVLAVTWGTQTAALQTAADGLRLLPAGRTTDIPWLGINQLPITLSQAYSLTAADVVVSSAIGVNYGPVTVSGSGTNYVITLAQPINAADLVTLIVDNPGVSVFYRQLDVLPGDFNDDGVVNAQDLAGIRNEWLGINGAKPTIFGDIIGNGTVNVADYNAERLLIGTSLPSVSDALIVAGGGSQGGTALVRIGTGGSSPSTTASPALPRAEIQLSGRGSSLGTSAIGTTVNQAPIEKSTSHDTKRLTRSFDIRRKHRLSVRTNRLTDGHDSRSRNEDILHDKR